jgi:hypothetical protein
MARSDENIPQKESKNIKSPLSKTRRAVAASLDSHGFPRLTAIKHGAPAPRQRLLQAFNFITLSSRDSLYNRLLTIPERSSIA